MIPENTKSAFEAMQSMATASWPKINDATSQHMRTFWKNQEKILDSMSEFSQSWFARRRKATESGIDAARSIGAAKTPVEAFQHLQAWMMGSADRLMADSFACQKHMMNVAETVASHIPAEAEQIKSDVMTTLSAVREAQSRAEAA